MRLLDATVVSEPGRTGSQWRIHYSLCLPALECDHFVLTSTKGAGAAERFAQFKFQANDLVLADAGYSHPPGVQSIVEQNAAVCVRLNPHALPLYNKAGERFDLTASLSKLTQAGESRSDRCGFMSAIGNTKDGLRRFVRARRRSGGPRCGQGQVAKG